MTDALAMQSVGAMRYRITVHTNYALVYYKGAPESIEVAEEWRRIIEAFLREHGLDRVIWDSRDGDPNPPQVREYIWTSLSTSTLIRASAIVVQDRGLKARANLSAFGRGLRLKAFHNLDDARAWITDPDLDKDST